jgi:hypothetical protein
MNTARYNQINFVISIKFNPIYKKLGHVTKQEPVLTKTNLTVFIRNQKLYFFANLIIQSEKICAYWRWE